MQPSGAGTTTSVSLIDRARQRDPDAWRRLCQIYAPLIYSWVRKAGVREHDAADVVQDVFRIVSTHLDRFRNDRPSDTFRGWLITITHNEVCGFQRRHVKESPAAVGGSTAQLQLQQTPFSRALDGSSSSLIGGELDRREILRRAAEIIRNDFEPHTWQAFWRSGVEEQAPHDIASDLNMTPNALRQARFRVLARLRKTIGDEWK